MTATNCTHPTNLGSSYDRALGPVMGAELDAQNLTCADLVERGVDIPAEKLREYAIGEGVKVSIEDVWQIACALGIDVATFFQRIHDARELTE